MQNNVNNPSHYGGEGNQYEAIKVIEAWGLDFNTGNAFKYVARAGKKDAAKYQEDLDKAIWYLNRQVEKPIYFFGNKEGDFLNWADDKKSVTKSVYHYENVAEAIRPNNPEFADFCKNLFYGYFKSCILHVIEMKIFF